MFEDAIRYPYDEGEGLRALAIGGVLTLLSFLLFPAVLVAGYAVRVIRGVAAGESHPPTWEDWGGLFVDGLKAFVVAVVYLLVPSLLVLAAIAAVFVPLSTPVPAVVGLVARVVAVVSLPLLLAALYVAPAGLANFAVSGRLGAAFAVRRFRHVLTSGTYAVAWLLALVVTVVVSAVGSAVGTDGNTAVFVVWSFVVFYGNVVAAYLYARGFSGAKPVTSSGAGDVTQPTA